MTQTNRLERFLAAQQGEYATALLEVRQGRKRSHWIWYVFPQIRGLGFSQASQYYGIADLAEAQAYAAHPLLGARLREITEALLALETDNIRAVMPHPDHLKLCSSMTLFALAVPEEPLFQRVLDKYYGGQMDRLTLDKLGL